MERISPALVPSLLQIAHHLPSTEVITSGKVLGKMARMSSLYPTAQVDPTVSKIVPAQVLQSKPTSTSHRSPPNPTIAVLRVESLLEKEGERQHVRFHIHFPICGKNKSEFYGIELIDKRSS